MRGSASTRADSATSSGSLLAPMMATMLITSIVGGQFISRTGRYRWMPKLPFVLGNEMSGEIVETGSDVRSLKVGQKVFIAGYDDRFCRMWEFYLAGCEVAFRYMNQMVFQVQIARRQDAVPITRDYMLEVERSLPQRSSIAAE